MAISTNTTTTKPNADTVIPRGNYRGKHTGKSYEPKNHWVVCDVCGFDIRAKDIRMTWDNRAVCPSDWEPRHPQDFVRSKYDHIRADDPVRPPPEDIFIEVAPSGDGGPFLMLIVETTGVNMDFVANLTWTEVLNENVTEYKVYRDDVLIASPGNVLMYDDPVGAEIGLGTFTYYVTAVNSAGESRPSNRVTVDNPLETVLLGWDPVASSTQGTIVDTISWRMTSGQAGAVKSINTYTGSNKYQLHYTIDANTTLSFPFNTFYCIVDPATNLVNRPWDVAGQNALGVGDNAFGSNIRQFRGRFAANDTLDFDIQIRLVKTDTIDLLADFDDNTITVLKNGEPLTSIASPETPIGSKPIPSGIDWLAYTRIQTNSGQGPNTVTNDFEADTFTPEEGFLPWDIG